MVLEGDLTEIEQTLAAIDTASELPDAPAESSTSCLLARRPT